MSVYKHKRGQWMLPDTGEHVDQQAFLTKMATKQVVLLGERHDIAEVHRWQLHTATYLHAYRPNMMMGFEMFPRTMQPIIDLWVAGQLSTIDFLEQVQWAKTWGFPAEIYLPLFHFCRQQHIKMLALNCPRELVTRVGKEGWEAIPPSERDGLSPAASALQGYRAYLLKQTQGRFIDPVTKDLPDRFIRAQQTWDRAFACNIYNAIENANTASNDIPLIVGIIGKGHVEYGYGTPHQLKDLGVKDVGILLPTLENTHNAEEINTIADGLFLLDKIEPFAERKQQQ